MATPLRLLACVLPVLAAASCASEPSEADPAAAERLSADLFPFSERTVRFAAGRGRVATLRVVPQGNEGADLFFEGGARGALHLRALRREDAIFLSSGPGQGTELLRIGAEPGDVWESRFEQIRFDGWERVQVPAGSFDAARITTRSGPDALPQIETWWFARGEGIVRMLSNYGVIFSEEMQLLGAGGDAAPATPAPR